MKFSVLIPTRDRLELLKSAIKSVLNQTYQNWEIIVSDNCSKEDIKSYIDSIEDNRIIYIKAPKPISVTENWNLANNSATGDYVIMLGDDDALMDNYFEQCINIIENFNYPDMLNYAAYIYTQPNVIPQYPGGLLESTLKHYDYIKDLKKPEILSLKTREDLVQKSLKFDYGFGFNMQYFLLKKDFIQNLKQYGELYQGPYPDYYTANMSMLLAQNAVLIPKELVVIGVTPKSYGYYYHNKKEKLGMKFHNASKYRKTAPKNIRPKLCNISEMDTAALATFALILEKLPHRKNLILDLDKYYKRVTNYIFEKYPKNIAKIIYLAEVLPKTTKEIFRKEIQRKMDIEKMQKVSYEKFPYGTIEDVLENIKIDNI